MEANISPAIANPNPNALSSTRFVPINFNHSLSVKLDNKNFLIWKQQIVSAIRGYGLQKFVFSDDEVQFNFSPEKMRDLEKQLRNSSIGYDTSFLLWGRLEQYFASQTRAKAKQFKTQLQHTKKGGSTIDEYLAKIKVCVDSLASVGVSLSTKDHVESILDGLPNDYESFVTSVILRNDDFSVEEIEALLMAHESRVEKNNNSLDSSPSAHVASSNAVEKGNRFKQDYYAANSQGSHSGYNGGFGRGGDFGRRGGFYGGRGFNWNYNGRSNRGGFRGRGNKGSFQARPPWNSDNQNEKPACQLCGKIGHVVAQCYYRFDHTFQVPQNLSSRNSSPRAYYSFSPQVNGVIPTSEVFSDDNWYPDSGASNHVTPNPENLMKSAEFAGQNQVHVGNGTASPPVLSPTMLPTPTSPISSARPISEMDNIVSTHPHAPNSADTTLTPAQVVSNPVATPVQHVVSSIADASVTRTIAKDADNTHPMITRAKSGIVKPKIFIAAIREPSSVSAALQQDEWKKAMVAEYDALQRNNTWSLVPLPAGRQAIGCKWVYKTKENPDGTVQKYKARLVAKGFHQQAGFDFTETFSPVVKPSTVRVVFTIALSRNWAIKQLDVNNAFLNGDLQEEVFMQQPQGFIDEQNPNLVCRLHKALYGLKQAPRAWFEKLHRALLSFGFVSAKSDQSLFLRFTPNHITYVLVYVDDILVIGSDTAAITSLIAQLNSEFSLKDLGEVHYFLGIQVSHTNNGLHLSQTKYIRDLLQKTKMVHCKPARTPLPTGLKLRVGDGDPVEDLHGYRSTVGALQYVTITRPELSFSVNKVCQFMQNPTEEHWKVVKRILRYLQGTLQHGLHLKKSSNLDLIGFCDADWASDLDDRRSTSGHCVFLGPNLISWQSKKQHIVSRSSIEIEYRSLAGLVAEITWLRSLLSELQLPLAKPPLVWCDNLSTVLLSANPVLHARTKHIELDLYFVREKVIRKEVEVRHVPSADQLADVLTKTVSSTQFIEFRHKLRIENLSTLSLRGDVRVD
eukprot:XP_019080407.1 PREDICTED: uncharacterized protein LOC109123862 [Vitis vinifera]